MAGAGQQMPPEDKQKTAMKVIVTGESEKVVGIHIIGMGADEMMQGFGVAMKVRTNNTTRLLKTFSCSTMYGTVLLYQLIVLSFLVFFEMHRCGVANDRMWPLFYLCLFFQARRCLGGRDGAYTSLGDK